MRDGLRELVREHGRLSTPPDAIRDDTDLYALGLDSVAVVNVMLAIEETFDVEIPDRLLTRRSFSSIAALDRMLDQALADAG